MCFQGLNPKAHLIFETRLAVPPQSQGILQTLMQQLTTACALKLAVFQGKEHCRVNPTPALAMVHLAK
jgi:hypothetical protein